MDGYLSKPIQPDEFFDVLDRHLGGSSVPAPFETVLVPSR
jgi:hypothetical protein